MELTSSYRIKRKVSVPGDKSISHRSIMFASIANGITEVRNFLQGADCLATIDCFRNMGIEIEERQNRIHRTRQGAARTECVLGNVGGGKQRNNYPPDLRYSCRAAI